jgi:hypothetical protein
MRPMLKPLLLAALLLGLVGCEASHPLYPTGIYRTAAAFRRRQPSLAGTKAGLTAFQHKVFVINQLSKSARRTKTALDSVWGYAAADGQAYRTYRRGAYKVAQEDTLMIYSRHEGKATHFYFSTGLAGPVIALNKKMLRQTFADNTAFINLLGQLRWYESPLAPVQAPTTYKTYKIAALYRQSLTLPGTQPR